MASHVMTPARRAALRKAQLESARRRRKHGPGQAVKKATRQRSAYVARSAQVALRNPQQRRSVVRKAAIGVGAAVVLGGAAYGGAKYHGSDRAYINRGMRKARRGKTFPTKAHKEKFNKRVKPLITHNAKRRKK